MVVCVFCGVLVRGVWCLLWAVWWVGLFAYGWGGERCGEFGKGPRIPKSRTARGEKKKKRKGPPQAKKDGGCGGYPPAFSSSLHKTAKKTKKLRPPPSPLPSSQASKILTLPQESNLLALGHAWPRLHFRRFRELSAAKAEFVIIVSNLALPFHHGFRWRWRWLVLVAHARAS